MKSNSAEIKWGSANCLIIKQVKGAANPLLPIFLSAHFTVRRRIIKSDDFDQWKAMTFHCVSNNSKLIAQEISNDFPLEPFTLRDDNDNLVQAMLMRNQHLYKSPAIEVYGRCRLLLPWLRVPCWFLQSKLKNCGHGQLGIEPTILDLSSQSGAYDFLANAA